MLFDWNMAAHWWRMDLQSFRDLPSETQAEMIATYRLDQQIKAIEAYKQAQKANAPKPQKKKR